MRLATRRFLQFRLRFLLLLVAIAGVVSAWLGNERHRYGRERYALTQLAMLTDNEAIIDTEPTAPAWLAPIGIDHLFWPRARAAHLGELGLTDEAMVHVGCLTELHYLVLSGNRITDNGLTHLAALGRLDNLWLERTDISDEG